MVNFGQTRYFKNRKHAGKLLAEKLKNIKGSEAIVYALPRGGVVVGAQIAKVLVCPLDLIIAKKIGHPLSSEYAIGAVTENGQSVLNAEEAGATDKKYLAEETKKMQAEAKRRRILYLGNKKTILATGKSAILVDDGAATGLTLKAAIKELKSNYQPKEIIVAVPVAPKEVVSELERMGIKVETILSEDRFLGAIGAYYEDFSPVEDWSVQQILKEFN